MKPFMICDNSFLLQRVSTIEPEPSTRRCLYSEADVELQILDTLKQLQADPTYMHVKSHQDNSIPVEELSWNSQLNVRCDEMASATLKTLETKSKVTMFPASRVLLEINGITITHHQSSQIRRAYSKKKSREYLTYHHRWTDEFDTVDWDTVHAKYMKMTFHKRLFITKWVNKILPLNQQRFKQNLYTTPYCPSWCQHMEHEEHFLTCNHKARRDHTKAFHTTISSAMKAHTLDPYLREIVFFLSVTWTIVHQQPIRYIINVCMSGS